MTPALLTAFLPNHTFINRFRSIHRSEGPAALEILPLAFPHWFTSPTPSFTPFPFPLTDPSHSLSLRVSVISGDRTRFLILSLLLSFLLLLSSTFLTSHPYPPSTVRESLKHRLSCLEILFFDSFCSPSSSYLLHHGSATSGPSRSPSFSLVLRLVLETRFLVI